MRRLKTIYRFVATLPLLLALPHGVSAIVFSFDDVNFADGVLDQSFDIDPNNEGDDIRISFTRDTDYFQTYDGQDSPYTSGLFGDGFTLDEDTLALLVNFTEDTMRVRVRIDFLYANGVSGVQIPIYDVDAGSDAGNNEFTFTDEVDRVRSRMDGNWTNFDASTVDLDPTTNAYSVSRNSIYGLTSTANNADEGNILLEFEDTVMTRVIFDYRNYRPTTPDDPALQGIGLGDIVFEPIIPESSQYGLLVGLFVSSVCLMRRG